jgi:hypothetical protein
MKPVVGNRWCHRILDTHGIVPCVLAWFFVCTFANESAATPAIEVDASVPSMSVVKDPNEMVSFKVLNLIPKDPFPYSLGVENQQKLEPPLNLGPLLTAAPAGGANPCTQTVIPAVRKRLSDATSESQIKELVPQLGELLKTSNAAVAAGGCTQAQLDEAKKELMESTIYVFPGTFEVRESRSLVFSVSRDKKVIAETTVTSPDDATWLLSYGVTFLRSKDVGAFSKAALSPATGFVVTEKADRASFNYVPSVFMMRKPLEEKRHRWCGKCVIGPAFGLGTDLSNVSALAGLGARWGDNITLTAGVALAKEKRLNGKYHFGDFINESLSEDQLSESTWGSTFFVGITIRSLEGLTKKSGSAQAGKKDDAVTK